MAGEYHEPYELLPDEAIEFHRMIKSVIEELEAVDWYNQRAAVTKDPALKAIVEHNRDEEIEHACMGLEWLRRNFPAWDENLRTYLFTEAPITEIEEAETGGHGAGHDAGPETGEDSSLGIKSLK
jgi:ferritin-like protein